MSQVDDILSMIDKGDDDAGAQKKSSTQSLRERMLSESNNNAPKPQQQLEAEVEEEILEEEEPKKSGVNVKVIIIAGLLLFAIVIFVIIQLGKSKPEEPVEEVIEQPVITEPVATAVPEIQYTPVTYSVEQISDLQAAGASYDQIQQWQSQGTPYEYVYCTLLERYYAFQLTNKLPIYDLTSPEYKELIGDTWMALDKRDDIIEWTMDEYLAFTYEEKQNLDYEKVEPYGNQLFLKVFLDATNHESWFFLNVTPQEWNQLDDEGNVVVSYTYCTHYLPYEDKFSAVEDKENIFITGATLDIIESLKNRNPE